ncbi:MAG TPA: FKBP-type peptidyl-prolyl cis-trans isomerase [Niabella sp.]|nr:FKBP-type peptidyl-prolyl cis-trans isomerase [Niabella sp.]
MKKFLFVLSAGLLLITAVTGCLKNEKATPCVSKTVQEELPAMIKYATDSSITYQQHESGILYEIIEPGTGANPTATSTVKAKYQGRLLNGQLFDGSTDGVSFNLSEVIKGWTIAVPLLKKGGKMKMIIPSSLAYDCHPYYPFFHNKPLYFYIELVDVQ